MMQPPDRITVRWCPACGRVHGVFDTPVCLCTGARTPTKTRGIRYQLARRAPASSSTEKRERGHRHAPMDPERGGAAEGGDRETGEDRSS